MGFQSVIGYNKSVVWCNLLGTKPNLFMKHLEIITSCDRVSSASMQPQPIANYHNMMTSLNGNIFHVTGPLCGEFTVHRWIPRAKASDAELWCFLWSAPEPTLEHTMETLVIWDATVPIMTSLYWLNELGNTGSIFTQRIPLFIPYFI